MKETLERSLDEFKVLRQYLINQYPYLVIPPLPSKISAKKTEKQLKKYFKRFILTLIRQEIFKCNWVVFKFFTEEDMKKVHTEISRQQNNKFDGTLGQLITETGQALV